MGRLDDIIARNKEPRLHKKGGRIPYNIIISAFVLLILFLVIFTDLDETPRDAQQASPPAQTDKKRVDGVLLYREKKSAPRDAGVRD